MAMPWVKISVGSGGEPIRRVTTRANTRAQAGVVTAAVGDGKRTQPSMPWRDRKPREASMSAGLKASAKASAALRQPTAVSVGDRSRAARSPRPPPASATAGELQRRALRKLVKAAAARKRAASTSARAGPLPKNAPSRRRRQRRAPPARACARFRMPRQQPAGQSAARDQLRGSGRTNRWPPAPPPSRGKAESTSASAAAAPRRRTMAAGLARR